MGKFFKYFTDRPWLIAWFAVVTAALLILGLTGHIYIQGDGNITTYEVQAFLFATAVWCIAKYGFKKDLTAEFILGATFGCQWEFLTWSHWTYLPDKFNILIVHRWGLPLIMIPCWGSILALVICFSNFLAGKVLKIPYKKLIFDKRILLCDMIAVQVIGCVIEAIVGVWIKAWTYDIDYGMGKSPIGLPWDIHIGYCIIIFWYATTMRVWNRRLDGDL